MRLAVAVHRNDLGLRKSVRGLDGIVHVHGEMKGAASWRRPRTTTRCRGGSGAPARRRHRTRACRRRHNRWPLVDAEHETDDVARQGLYAGPCRAGVAVTHSAPPSDLVIAGASHAARPTALPP